MQIPKGQANDQKQNDTILKTKGNVQVQLVGQGVTVL